MRISSWNWSGLGGPSTNSQLKESQRLYLPDITFVCETKQKIIFIKTMCWKLKCNDNWVVVEPKGKRGGLLLFWDAKVTVSKIVKSTFNIEVEVEGKDIKGKWWIIFFYLSP